MKQCRLFVICSILFVLTGCSITKVKVTGETKTFTTYRLFDKTSLADLEVPIGTNTLILRGYSGSREQFVKDIAPLVEHLARGFASGAIPQSSGAEGALKVLEIISK